MIYFKRPFLKFFIFTFISIYIFDSVLAEFKIFTDKKIIIWILRFSIIIFSFLFSQIKISLDISNSPGRNSFFILSILVIFLLTGLNFKISTSSSKLSEEYIKGRETAVKNTGTSELFKAEIEEVFTITEKKEGDYGISYEAESDKYGEKTLLRINNGPEFKKGDIVKVKGKIRYPGRRRNPKVFDYRNYLKSKKIFTITDADYSEFIRESGRRDLESEEKFRDLADSALSLIKDERNANFMKSVITGDSSFIEKEELEKISSSGLSHAIAVSGFHTGLLFTAVSAVLTGLLRFRRRISAVISLMAVLIYINLIGMPVSALRAFLMILALNIGIIMERRTDSMNILGFTGFTMLVFSPELFYSLSFILSFSGVMSIYIFSEKMSEIFTEKMGLSTVMGIMAGTLPISTSYFNSVSVSHVFSNVFGLLPFAAAFYFSAAGIAVFPLFPEISEMIFSVSDFLLTVMHRLIDFFYIEALEVKSLNLTELITVYFLIFTFIFSDFYVKTPELFRRFFFRLLIFSSVFSMFMSISPFRDKNAYVKFIDIGQGNSALISSEGRNFLFDTGEENVTEYLLKNGYTDIEGLFISHFDSDHAGDAAETVKRLNVKKVYMSHFPEENKCASELRKEAEKRDTELIKIEKISKIQKDGLGLILIPPDRKLLNEENENEKSLFIIAEVNGRRIIFPGDTEEKAEKYFSGMNIPKADIINVPHHGSATSSSEKLLDRVRPETAVIQCGVSNRYSHPSEEVLKRYKERGTEILRNDLEGMIEIVIDSDGKTDKYFFLRNGLEEKLKKKKYALISAASAFAAFFRIIYFWRENLSENLKIQDFQNSGERL